MKNLYKCTFMLFVFLFATLMMGEEIGGEIIVFHAGSLSVPFAQIEKAFESQYPGTDVIRETAGSIEAVRKVTDLGREADVIGSADYTVIENLMIPEYTEWYINFANNEMVIMYTEDSRYKYEINSDNWYEILLRPDVEYGHSDPNADPCGYRSQIVWKLAEKYYGVDNLYQKLADNRPLKNVRPKETDLIALLEVGELDYIFIYKSVALQHQMPYVELPEQINLKSTKYADFYATASFDVTGKEPGGMITQVGQPMVYALTIPKNAPNPKGAIAFIKFVVDPQGRAIMEENGQPPIIPPEGVNIEKAPQEIQDFLKGGAND
ncbi:tungstate ABC transporter substrate-binding protein WtpA [Petrotoga olearia]|uniref:ABC transporter substrate-binding protein n=2 Tax=Petrotoga olearia TaxID=156203 RepID=A0A2K1P5D3_9BACT|nr:tungstate ABC transporter substrate-binding protein WtpA [Petrotoga olearia]PNR97982.1 ABC transporter substrate-binding protein [Petrotoga olearia DSM 13574]RMA75558.1 molybdate/tungstate transport system substrate-binding protein [Petrotoga olearia]